jgi:hypothetical protein
VIRTSAVSGEGLTDWLQWLESGVRGSAEGQRDAASAGQAAIGGSDARAASPAEGG